MSHERILTGAERDAEVAVSRISMPRHRPRGPLARTLRAPAFLYRHGMGWLLGRRFLMITHRGRRTGRILHTVVEVVDRLPTGEYTVISAWGDDADWFRNIRIHPALEVAVGGRRFVPNQRLLDQAEAFDALRAYRRRHPLALRLLAWLLEWPGSDDLALAEAAGSTPMVAFGQPSPTKGPEVAMSRVRRPRAEAARTYDRLSRVYDASEGVFERAFQDLGLRLLAAQPRERILEIGHGTGRCLVSIGRAVGPEGRVSGLDISRGMHDVAARRLQRAGLGDRTELRVGDAISLPYDDGVFDGVFTSFALELFDTPDIPIVLRETRRVLRSGGRLAVVALAAASTSGMIPRAYEWGHERLPSLLDCRPIAVREMVVDAGFRIERAVLRSMFGLPLDAVLARRDDQRPLASSHGGPGQTDSGSG